MNKPFFRIYLYAQDLSDYLDRMGINEHAYWMTTEIVDDCDITPETLKEIALFVLMSADRSALEQIEDRYGVMAFGAEKHFSTMLTCIANSILEDCCKPIFELKGDINNDQQL